MIRLMLGDYTKQEKAILRFALSNALDYCMDNHDFDSIAPCEKTGCTDCIYRKPCNDIKLAISYLEK